MCVKVFFLAVILSACGVDTVTTQNSTTQPASTTQTTQPGDVPVSDEMPVSDEVSVLSVTSTTLLTDDTTPTTVTPVTTSAVTSTTTVESPPTLEVENPPADGQETVEKPPANDQNKPVNGLPKEPVENPPADHQEKPKPISGGTLRVAVEAEGDGLNPGANNFAVSSYIMAFTIFEPLTYWNVDGGWVPYIAESFTMLDDGLRWEMKLRENILFHDGSELQADDVIATFNTQISDPILSQVLLPNLPKKDPIKKIDKYTVQYNLLKPEANFPVLFTGQIGMVAPAHWLEKARKDRELNQMPVGTGPFMIDERVKNQKTVLVRNPNYWGAFSSDTATSDTAVTANIYLDRIEVTPITEPSVAAAHLIDGKIDVMVATETEAILALRNAASEGVITIEDTHSSEDLVVLNAEKPPFDDIRVRKAITFATSQQKFIDHIRQGTTVPAHSIFHPDLIWHNPNVKQETDNPNLAAPLISDYCAENPSNCTNGKVDIELLYGGSSDEQLRTNKILIESWQDYFNITEKELLQSSQVKQVALGNFQVTTWRQFGDPDPYNEGLWFRCSTIGLISLNWSRHCSAELDDLFDKQRSTTSMDERVEIWHKAQQHIKDAYIHIFLSHTNWTIGAHDHVKNICGYVIPNVSTAESTQTKTESSQPTTNETSTKLLCNNQGRLFLSQIWLNSVDG